jgi:hypothetical protein
MNEPLSTIDGVGGPACGIRIVASKAVSTDRRSTSSGNVLPSIGPVGDALDNAMCGSFFAKLQCELIDRHRFANRAEA